MIISITLHNDRYYTVAEVYARSLKEAGPLWFSRKESYLDSNSNECKLLNYATNAIYIPASMLSRETIQLAGDLLFSDWVKYVEDYYSSSEELSDRNVIKNAINISRVDSIPSRTGEEENTVIYINFEGEITSVTTYKSAKKEVDNNDTQTNTN